MSPTLQQGAPQPERVEVTGLTVRYGNTAVLRDVDTAFDAGRVTALIGANGAGKSTFLKAVAGLVPSAGKVLWKGRALTRRERVKAFAYMPQDVSGGFSLTLIETVLLGRVTSLGASVALQLMEEAVAALERFGLADLATRPLGAVSGGQRQLTFLAQALFRRPEVLLLDEPTAALDLRHQLIVLETVSRIAREEGIVVMLALHDLNLAARFADALRTRL